jgi:hypothetical protein|tara:strand:+ start:696 stop:1310 length:615 start_codon:yes stop_codon:yes gene_type:complete
MINIEPIDFELAKILYKRYHRTNRPPVGHRKSFIIYNETEEWQKLFDADYSESDLHKWFNKYYYDNSYEDDFIIVSDDAGDPHLYFKGKILGILSIGNPVARFKNKKVFEITRICFLPDFNPLKDGFDLPSYFVKESIKYFNYDYKFDKIITYIHKDQKGKYLEFAGFKKDKEIIYSKKFRGWSNRPNRNFCNLAPKLRFTYAK